MFFLEQMPDLYMFFSEYSWHIRFWPRRGGGGGVLDGLKKKSTPGDFWNPGAPLQACQQSILIKSIWSKFFMVLTTDN